ncbi:hypothetical protein [Crocosphaera sp. XPORK-15E]|uniref:hypothetical protein n=1 Tax=Crocosphaera sp. XPORK-15E TaxID=3110247 RepID=UPI002B216409|nr:hypothetical protein [Crocosphaera sp. XPORK-15E]MEA5533453.1 hypothetical protein [Crocosphaera sp. XPORK-15E]
MYQPCLPPDDLPSLDPSYRQLSWELEEVAGELFYKYCDPITQDLLSRCGWDVTTAGKGLTLVILCPNSDLNWQVLQSIPLLAESLQELSPWAKIRIYPPAGMGSAMEVMI